MIQKKICMVGASAVGKTSLVARYVRSIFSDKYLTTVGVKIDKKTVRALDRDVTLMLWDLAGEDEYIQLKLSYLQGASGYFLVADGTRRATLETAFELQARVESEIGAVPFILLLNKTDLADEWDLDDSSIARISEAGWRSMNTSAKTGAGVEEAFLALTEKMLAG
ncbi:MAG TPA: Rab family GTPase [Blastocatellia bacterium]|nr:Rab family GTPase [Blastocatellia bacterium]